MSCRQRKRQRYASMTSAQPGWGRAWPIHPDTSVRFQGRRYADMAALLAEMEAATQELWCGITPAMEARMAADLLSTGTTWTRTYPGGKTEVIPMHEIRVRHPIITPFR